SRAAPLPPLPASGGLAHDEGGRRPAPGGTVRPRRRRAPAGLRRLVRAERAGWVRLPAAASNLLSFSFTPTPRHELTRDADGRRRAVHATGDRLRRLPRRDPAGPGPARGEPGKGRPAGGGVERGEAERGRPVRGEPVAGRLPPV